MAILSNGALLETYHTLTEDYGEDPKTAMRGLEIVADFIEPIRCGKCAEKKDFCTGCKTEKYQKKISGNYFGHANDADEIIETIYAIGETIKESNQTAADLAEDCTNLRKKISEINEFENCEIPSSFFKTDDKVNSQIQKIKEKTIGFDSVADRIDRLEDKLRNPAQPKKFDISKTERPLVFEKKKFSITIDEKNSQFYG